MVTTAEFVEQGKVSPQLTVMFDALREPEQVEGPEQVVVGAAQGVPLIMETEELLKLCGKCDGAAQA